jgi:hypothetical protein
MTDLVFGILMLATFSSTFIFNKVYVRYQGGGEKEETAVPQSPDSSPREDSPRELEDQKGPQ